MVGRPESQNKLFSVVHERRVQGLQLEHLRYRWAAMNPPPSPDGETDGEWAYTGSLPLDPALADRFAYVVRVPEFGDFSPEVRRIVIARGGESPAEERADIGRLIKRVCSRLKRIGCRAKSFVSVGRLACGHAAGGGDGGVNL